MHVHATNRRFGGRRFIPLHIQRAKHRYTNVEEKINMSNEDRFSLGVVQSKIPCSSSPRSSMMARANHTRNARWRKNNIVWLGGVVHFRTAE